MKRVPQQLRFSDQLETWLKADSPKTVASLEAVFGKKSLVVLIVLLMVLPTLPVPTGGIAHLFEVIAMLLALELMIGIKSVWLPRRWRTADLSRRLTGRLPRLVIKTIRNYERGSTASGRRVYGLLFASPLTEQFVGLILFVLILAAFLAPPFTGLDTLTSLSVLVMGLALIVEDIWLLALGLLLGVIGIALIIAFGSLLFTVIPRLL